MKEPIKPERLFPLGGWGRPLAAPGREEELDEVGAALQREKQDCKV